MSEASNSRFTPLLETNPLDPLQPNVVLVGHEEDGFREVRLSWREAVQLLHDLGCILEPFIKPFGWTKRGPGG
jgi:hypothetical protein